MPIVELKSNPSAPDMSAKQLINMARRKIRKDRRHCRDMISLIQTAWGIDRPLAAAVLFAEVKLKTVGEDDSQQFNWPVDTEVNDED